MSECVALVHGLVRVSCDTVTRSQGVRGEFCAFALILQWPLPFSQKSHCRTPYRTILEPRNPCHRTNPDPSHQVNQVHGELG